VFFRGAVFATVTGVLRCRRGEPPPVVPRRRDPRGGGDEGRGAACSRWRPRRVRVGEAGASDARRAVVQARRPWRRFVPETRRWARRRRRSYRSAAR